MTRKYALSGVFEMSKTWTMFACWRCSDSRASSRNIETNFWFFVRFGQDALDRDGLLEPLHRLRDAAKDLGHTTVVESLGDLCSGRASPTPR